jgi:hypothetical protein
MNIKTSGSKSKSTSKSTSTSTSTSTNKKIKLMGLGSKQSLECKGKDSLLDKIDFGKANSLAEITKVIGTLKSKNTEITEAMKQEMIQMNEGTENLEENEETPDDQLEEVLNKAYEANKLKGDFIFGANQATQTVEIDDNSFELDDKDSKED